MVSMAMSVFPISLSPRHPLSVGLKRSTHSLDIMKFEDVIARSRTLKMETCNEELVTKKRMVAVQVVQIQVQRLFEKERSSWGLCTSSRLLEQ